MRYLIFTALLLVAGSARAVEVRLALYEVQTKKTTFHALDLSTTAVRTEQAPGAAELPSLTAYQVRNRHAERVQGGAAIADADEILCQATAEGVDMLIVRQEYNSFANPLRWLAAFSGHPVQVSRIVWLLVRDGKLEKSIELKREPSSYHWEAKLSEVPPSKP